MHDKDNFEKELEEVTKSPKASYGFFKKKTKDEKMQSTLNKKEQAERDIDIG